MFAVSAWAGELPILPLYYEPCVGVAGCQLATSLPSVILSRAWPAVRVGNNRRGIKKNRFFGHIVFAPLWKSCGNGEISTEIDILMSSSSI